MLLKNTDLYTLITHDMKLAKWYENVMIRNNMELISRKKKKKTCKKNILDVDKDIPAENVLNLSQRYSSI